MSEIKIAAFFGSPRKDGNTQYIFDEALKGAKSKKAKIDAYNLCQMKINPCIDCGDCENTGECSTEDGMSKIYKAIRECNRFIFASPIFFYNFSSQAKAMIDRCQSFWCEKYLLKKPIVQTSLKRKGLLLMVGGMNNDIGQNCSQATAKAFFRTISVDEHNSLIFKGIDQIGAIKQHPDYLKQAFEEGKKLV